MTYFLLILVLLVATACATQNVDVVIVGAGTAGITALRTLTDAGRTNVVVLEANSRYGGRMNTVTVPGYPYPVELGCSFVADSNYNPMIQLFNQANIALQAMDFSNTKAWKDGRPLNANQGSRIYNNYLDIWSKAQPFFQTGRSKADAIRLGGYDFDDRGVETLLMTDEQIWGDNLEKIDSNANDEAPEPLGTNYLVPGGYKQILDYLLDYPTSTRSKLQLNSLVTKIDYSSPNGKTTVTYIQNSVTKQITANKVVVAIPMGVLKANVVTFVPALPADKQNSINTVNFGSCGKTFLFFPPSAVPILAQYPVNIFYRLGLLPNPRYYDALTYFYNNQYVQGQPVIQSFYCGNFSRNLELQSDAQIVALHMTKLREFLPTLPDPSTYLITRWTSDPLFRGVYTDFAVGNTLQNNFLPMTTPIQNKIYFAGEYIASLDANGNLLASLGNVYTAYVAAKNVIQQILGN